MVSFEHLTKKKLYSPSLQRYNLLHKNELQRFLYNSVDYYSRNMMLMKYMIEQPALGYFIIKDFITQNRTKINYMVDCILDRSQIAVVVGDAGTGKSAFAHWLTEEIHYLEPKRPLVFVRDTQPDEYPDWLLTAYDINEAPKNSIIFFDEAALSMPSRRAMQKANVNNMFNLAIRRHKGWSLVYITQHSSFIDISIIRMATAFFFKRLTWEESMRHTDSKHYERSIDTLVQYVDAMEPTSVDETLFWDGKVWYKFTTPLPSFWTERLSKSYGKMTMVDAIKYALNLRRQRLAYKEIVKRLEIRGINVDVDDIRDWENAPAKWTKYWKRAESHPEMRF